MDFQNHPLNRENSNSYSSSNELNNSDSNSIPFKQIQSSFTDLIPIDDYMPFYIKRYKELGYARYVYLATLARKKTTPARFFFWALKYNELVK